MVYECLYVVVVVVLMCCDCDVVLIGYFVVVWFMIVVDVY